MEPDGPILDYSSAGPRWERRHRAMWASHLMLAAGAGQLGLMCIAGAFGVWIGAAIIIVSVAIPIWIARRMRKAELRRICLVASATERDIERLRHHFNLNLFVLCSIAAVHLIWILPQRAYNMEQARLAAESVQVAVRGLTLARECAEFADAHQNRLPHSREEFKAWAGELRSTRAEPLWNEFVLVGGGEKYGTPGRVLFHHPKEFGETGYVVVLTDGTVEHVSRDKFRELIKGN